MAISENVPADGVLVPGRFPPFPRSISSKARTSLAALAAQRPAPSPEAEPSLPDDSAEWAALVGLVNAGIVAMQLASHGAPRAVTETLDVEGLTIYRSTPAEVDPADAPFAFLDIHRGAFTYGEGRPVESGPADGRTSWVSDVFLWTAACRQGRRSGRAPHCRRNSPRRHAG